MENITLQLFWQSPELQEYLSKCSRSAFLPLWFQTQLYKARRAWLCLLSMSARFSDASVKIPQIFSRSEDVDKSESSRSQAVSDVTQTPNYMKLVRGTSVRNSSPRNTPTEIVNAWPDTYYYYHSTDQPRTQKSLQIDFNMKRFSTQFESIHHRHTHTQKDSLF